MPSRARACVGRASRSASSKFTVPLETFSRPMRLFMNVVLPAPLRPISPAMLPRGSSSETSRRMGTPLMATFSPRMLSMDSADHIAPHLGVVQRGLRRRVGDDAPVVEREHAPGEAAHHLHVVLDEDHGGALGFH